VDSLRCQVTLLALLWVWRESFCEGEAHSPEAWCPPSSLDEKPERSWASQPPSLSRRGSLMLVALTEETLPGTTRMWYSLAIFWLRIWECCARRRLVTHHQRQRGKRTDFEQTEQVQTLALPCNLSKQHCVTQCQWFRVWDGDKNTCICRRLRQVDCQFEVASETHCWTSVSHTCNSSYSGGKDQEDRGLKPAQANSSQDPIKKKKKISKKSWWVAQGVDHEFKSQYQQGRRKTFPLR
jgi:hypothetical protein